MQYKYNKDTNSLELVNRNSIIVNNVISSGTGVTLTVTTDEEDFYGKTVNLTDGNKTIISQFSNEGIAVFNNVDMEGELTAEITVGEKKFSSKIEVKSNYNTILKKYQTYSLSIDLLEENPSAWGTWIDDAVNMTPVAIGGGENEMDKFMGYYPVAIDRNGNEIDLINPNNYLENIEKNTLQDSNLIMVKFPAYGYRIYYTDENTLIVSVTNEPNKKDYRYLTYKSVLLDSFYISAYLANTVTESSMTIAQSKTKVIPSTNISLPSWREYVHNLGSNFEVMYYDLIVYLLCCMTIKYKGNNIQSILGLGYVGGSNSDIPANGMGDLLGLNYGTTVDTVHTAKMFGIEHFWGNHMTWVEGCYFNDKNQLCLADGYFNESVDSDKYEKFQLSGSYGGIYLHKPIGDTRVGFLPSSTSDNGATGSNDKYFCDKVSTYNGRWGTWGAHRETNDYRSVGPYNIDIGSFLDYSSWNDRGIRIAYLKVREG